MQKELRYAIEPNIDKDNFKWEDVVTLAEKHDYSLWQAPKYGNQGSKKPEAFAMVHQQSNHQNKKKSHVHNKQGKQHPPRKGNPKLYQERKQNKTCHFCGKPGHMIAECRSRIHQKKSERVLTVQRWKTPLKALWKPSASTVNN